MVKIQFEISYTKRAMFTPKIKNIIEEDIIMSRFTGSSWKVSRRLNYSISETGKELNKRKYATGQHGAKRTKLK